MSKDFKKEQLIKKSEDFTAWYTDVILKSGLADHAPVRGCMIFRPYGFAVWENIQKILDEEIKKAGVENAYFPLFIPERLLKKEKEHVEGFSPELAVVTIGGGKKLDENLVVRPTSETIMHEMFAKWIKSWRDLPLKINQWCNVVRWEKRPRLFLRTTEFLWQEGHTVHATHKEALEEVKRALDSYVNLYKNVLAIDSVAGVKSESEKFPGAVDTYTVEMLMPDGKALQSGTSHDLGQNFAEAFNIRFLDAHGKTQTPWQTSWGLTTRAIGALIMVHGDDSGLIMPPRIAPVQVVIVPVLQGKPADKKIIAEAEKLKVILKNFRVKIDSRKEYSMGWKFNDWELKGVPLRIEIGPQEIQKRTATLVRRDNREKAEIKITNLASETKRNLDLIQKGILAKSSQYLKKNIREVSDYQTFKNIMEKEKGFIKAFWCENAECEAKIKKETKATTRVLPFNTRDGSGKCIYCGKKSQRKWIFAQAY